MDEDYFYILLLYGILFSIRLFLKFNECDHVQFRKQST
ncbi:hypothetical protein LEP1GSC064_3184 [Leptospira kirschneri serovar Grippotyphosa str. Moskva]|nr:hypothetical protein LEP1GSC064_3184 [Leptospira kirschneri serovar Grippotyphosa str. Moskva]EKR09700.1 hypothetical protein LEP1GSC122_1831 [Leptospira kirschneri serovar Valbuzzi str. 200702274]